LSVGRWNPQNSSSCGSRKRKLYFHVKWDPDNVAWREGGWEGWDGKVKNEVFCNKIIKYFP
jgi:hypothetical protein